MFLPAAPEAVKRQMKKQIGIIMVLLAVMAGRAQVTNLTVNTTVNQTVPVGFTPLSSSSTVSSMVGPIINVSVTLNISGGWNGNLYCYLLSPDDSMVVLLNRAGLSSSNPWDSYNDSGLNITLSASAANNIHNYQDFAGWSTSITDGSAWAPDQREVDPASDGSAFDSITGNNFTVYNGLNPNGVWTLNIVDAVGGAPVPATLVSWGLTIATVPEPQTWALLGTGLATLGWMLRRRQS